MNLMQFIAQGYLMHKYLLWKEDEETMTAEEVMDEIKKLEKEQMWDLINLMLQYFIELTADTPEVRGQIINSAYRMAQENVV